MNQKKHAYLIIAHNQFELLKMLCQLLDHPAHDIFIHIDSKASFDTELLKNATVHSPVIFTQRTNVMWGSYSMINCELILLKSALDYNPDGYAFYHLLSGADLPLKSADEIYNFFNNNIGKEFIQSTPGDAAWQIKMKDRINHYCIFQEKAGRSNKIWQNRQNKLRKLQYSLNIDRTKNLGKTIMSGAQWFSISHNLAQYVISNENWIKKYFNYTICADELFLQTLINGTDFENNLYISATEEKGTIACMRFIDWTRGDPYTFTENDFDELISSDYLFARKFDIIKQPNICYKIFNYIKGI